MRKLGAWLFAVAGLLVLLVVAAPVWGPLLGLGPPAPPAPGRRVEIGPGVHLNVFAEGTGPAIVLVHGLPGSAYGWQPLPERLVAAGYRVVWYDRLGYGHSDRRARDEDHGLEPNARDLLALVAALGLDRPLVLGWSYGSEIAQRAALDAGERIGGLVLVGTPDERDAGKKQPGPIERLMSSELVTRWSCASGIGARSAIRQMGAEAFNGAMPDWFPEHGLQTMAMPGVVHTFKMETELRARGVLTPQDLRLPVLILHGTGDRLCPYSIALDLHARISGSRLASVPGGSHMLPNTHADWIVEQVRTFAPPR
jgi:pimeloyl-ACP methyl ester carboxylesterase